MSAEVVKKKTYNFGEKETEYSVKHKKELPVWKSPKYEQAKKTVIKMLESKEYKDVLDESDFWILMNTTKTEKMAYTGLIISHNGCLKINDTLPDELKFNPICMRYESNDNEYNPTYNQSLIFIYDSSKMENDRQRIFEIGEVSTQNCTNAYPYAMGLKRCMDRVILKNSKLAYSGVYSDSEAEEFAEPMEDKKEESLLQQVVNQKAEQSKITLTSLATDKQKNLIMNLFADKKEALDNLLFNNYHKKSIGELTIYEASELIGIGKEL